MVYIPRMLRTKLALSLLVLPSFLLACSQTSDGPTPSLASPITPKAVCNAGNAENAAVVTTVVIKSNEDSFSPMATNVLNNATAALPVVTLTASGKTIELKRVAFVSAREIQATIGATEALAAGTYDVTVTNPNGHTTTATASIKIVDPPTVSDVKIPASPVSAICSAVDTVVTIDGTGFRPEDGAVVELLDGSGNVVLKGEAADVKIVDGKTIQLTVRGATPGKVPPGVYSVRVSGTEGPPACTATKVAVLKVVAPPTVTKIDPVTVCSGGGQVVNLTGTGFAAGMTVDIGTTPVAPVTVTSDTASSFTSPPLAPAGSPYDLTVKVMDGCTFTQKGALTVVAGPRLDSIDPARGWSGIDTPVTLYGDGFVAGSTVFVRAGGASGADFPLIDVNIVSGTIIRGTVPKGGAPGGPYDVVVQPPTGCPAVLVKSFTIDKDPALTISKVTPPFGWKDDKTPITISGDKFVSTPRAYLVIPSLTPKSTALKSTAFVSPQSLTSLVQKGLPVGGPYDLDVINPDGGGGKLPAAFRVVDKPIPTIDNVSPAAGTTQADTAVTITGCNFRSPKVDLVSAAGALSPATVGTLTCAGAATCPGGTSVCTLSATIKSTGAATGAYLVRVTNPDESTYGEYSAFVITNPSSKLEEGFKAAKPLTLGRRSLSTVSGRINSASRFLYAIAGEQADGTALDSIEVAPLDLFGNTGTWYAQRNRLNTPRSGAVSFQRGGYVYVLGGTSTKGGTGGASPAGTPLDTVERAKILDLSDQPQVADPETVAGTLGKGTWLYMVSAIKDGAADPDNPDGETLPSDEIVVGFGVPGGVKLSWTAVAGAKSYRIYRTAAANGASQTEVLLKDGITGTTYTDTGSDAPVTPTVLPLRPGSTAVWLTQTQKLAHARFNAGATLGADPSGAVRVYLVGGHGSCGTGGNVTMNCWEAATISIDGKTLGAFAAGTTTMNVARERLGVGALGKDNGPPGYTGNQSFVLASGGLGVSGSASSIEYAAIDAGGALTWKGEPGAVYSPKSKDGSALGVANGFAFAFAGGSPGSYTASVKRGGPGIIASMSTGVLDLTGFSDAVANVIVPAGAGGVGRFGFTLESAYFYVVGGTTNDTDAITTVSQVIY